MRTLALGHRLKPQVSYLTVFAAIRRDPFAAIPTSRRSATEAQNAHRDIAFCVSPPRRCGSSNTTASDPARLGSDPGDALGASVPHCSCTPPHYWHAPFRATPSLPAHTRPPRRGPTIDTPAAAPP